MQDLVRAGARSLAPILSDAEIQRVYRIAQGLHAAHISKDLESAEQAFGKILLGRDLGLTPAQSLMSLDVVRGQLRMRGVLLAAFIRLSPQYDYRSLVHTEEECQVEFRRRDPDGDGWEIMGVAKFTMEKARKARLVKPDSAWETWPENMLFWRCISNGVKFWCGDLMGGVPIYTEADDIPERVENLADGEGDGSEPGWGSTPIDVVARIEKVIRRGQKLGHGAYSTRGPLQLLLAGRPVEEIDRWIATANAELDLSVQKELQQPEGGEEVDGEVALRPASTSAPSSAGNETLEDLLAEANEMAQKASDAGEEDVAAEWSAKADALSEEIEAREANT